MPWLPSTGDSRSCPQPIPLPRTTRFLPSFAAEAFPSWTHTDQCQAVVSLGHLPGFRVRAYSREWSDCQKHWEIFVTAD